MNVPRTKTFTVKVGERGTTHNDVTIPRESPIAGDGCPPNEGAHEGKSVTLLSTNWKVRFR